MNSQKVSGEVFYHVCTSNQCFQLGDVLKSGEKNNPFYEQFFKQDVNV